MIGNLCHWQHYPGKTPTLSVYEIIACYCLKTSNYVVFGCYTELMVRVMPCHAHCVCECVCVCVLHVYVCAYAMYVELICKTDHFNC